MKTEIRSASRKKKGKEFKKQAGNDIRPTLPLKAQKVQLLPNVKEEFLRKLSVSQCRKSQSREPFNMRSHFFLTKNINKTKKNNGDPFLMFKIFAQNAAQRQKRRLLIFMKCRLKTKHSCDEHN